MRRFGRRSGTLTAPFVNNSRSKRSVAIDLERAEGVEVVKRIVSAADVFIQNFRPGVVAGLGLAGEVGRDPNPKLIYISISGFGDKGPLAHKPTYDPIVQAASGLASVQGASDAARPRMVRAMLPDKIAALDAAQAISTALYARAKTSPGQHISLSMLDAVPSFPWSGEMDGHTFLQNQVEGPEEFSPFDLIAVAISRWGLAAPRRQCGLASQSTSARLGPTVIPGNDGSARHDPHSRRLLSRSRESTRRIGLDNVPDAEASRIFGLLAPFTPPEESNQADGRTPWI